MTAGEKSHLMIFASRDWKFLAKETTIPSGRKWLGQFGFSGPPGARGNVSKGLEVGFEVVGERDALLDISTKLLGEITSFEQCPPQSVTSEMRIGRSSTPKTANARAWTMVLPPLIAFLSELSGPTVMIFNHHR